jgi:protein gp37
VKWVSIEPMLEPIIPADPSIFDWYVIGGASKNTRQNGFIPPVDWVNALVGVITTQVFLKESVGGGLRQFTK